MSKESNEITNATVVFDDHMVSIYGPEGERVMFSAVCPKCGKLVGPDDGVLSNILNNINDPGWSSQKERPLNATCGFGCGRVKMLFWIASFNSDKEQE